MYEGGNKIFKSKKKLFEINICPKNEEKGTRVPMLLLMLKHAGYSYKHMIIIKQASY